MTWNLGDQMRDRLGKGSNICLVPPIGQQEEQATTPSASPEGGFGGGAQTPVDPGGGESFDDAVRRRVFGG